MIQRLPEGDPGLLARGGEAIPDDMSEDDWRRAVAMLASTRAEELLATDSGADDLLYRLFHEDGVRVFSEVPLEFGCRCSEQRARNVLSSLPKEELRELIVDGRFEVVCEFCNSQYDLPANLFLD